MYFVASRTQQGAIGDSITAGELADLRLPADTWHAYRDGGTETACGIALTELHVFPNVPFLPQRTDDFCAVCLQGVQAL